MKKRYFVCSFIQLTLRKAIIIISVWIEKDVTSSESHDTTMSAECRTRGQIIVMINCNNNNKLVARSHLRRCFHEKFVGVAASCQYTICIIILCKLANYVSAVSTGPCTGPDGNQSYSIHPNSDVKSLFTKWHPIFFRRFSRRRYFQGGPLLKQPR